MKTTALKIAFVASLIFIFSCREKPKTYNGYSKQQDFYYKLVSLGDGTKKTDSTQCLWIEASCKNLADSMFWDTKHKGGQTFFVTKDSPYFLKSAYGFSVGDSLRYLFPTDKFFKNFFKSDVPFFCKKDSCVKFSLKIVRTLTANQFNEFNDSIQAFTDKQQSKEQLQIQNYVSKNCKQVNEFATNAFIEITHPTMLDSVKKGKKIKLFYKGYF